MKGCNLGDDLGEVFETPGINPRSRRETGDSGGKTIRIRVEGMNLGDGTQIEIEKKIDADRLIAGTPRGPGGCTGTRSEDQESRTGGHLVLITRSQLIPDQAADCWVAFRGSFTRKVLPVPGPSLFASIVP